MTNILVETFPKEFFQKQFKVTNTNYNIKCRNIQIKIQNKKIGQCP